MALTATPFNEEEEIKLPEIGEWWAVQQPQVQDELLPGSQELVNPAFQDSETRDPIRAIESTVADPTQVTTTQEEPIITPDIPDVPEDLEWQLQAQVDITREAQQSLERQKQDVLDRFEGEVSTADLEGLNQFEVQDLIKELELKEEERQKATKTLDEELAFQQRTRDRRLSLFDQRVTDLETSFENQISDAQTQNRLNNENANKIAALTWSSFSSKGQEGLQLIQTRGKNLISRLVAAKESALSSLATQREQIVDEFDRKFNSISRAQNDALNAAKTSFLNAALEIDAELDITTQQWLENLIRIKDDFLDRQNEITQNAQSQILFELDVAEQSMNIVDQIEDRERFQFTQDFERFSAPENLQNVSTAEIVQFAKRFPEQSEQITRTLVGQQIAGIQAWIDQELANFDISGYALNPEVQQRIQNAIEVEWRTPNDIMKEIIGEVVSSPEKLRELQEIGLSEAEIAERRVQPTVWTPAWITPTAISPERQARVNSYINNTWTGVVTQDYGDTSPLEIDNQPLADGTVWTPWIDIDWNIGDPIPSSISWTVKEVIQSDEGLWNRVIVEDKEGNLHYFSHMDATGVEQGQEIVNGQQLGTIWNSGSVIPWPQWDGSHLDYRVKNKAGQWVDPKKFMETALTPAEVQNKNLILSQVSSGLSTPSEISDFRSLAIEQGWGEELTDVITSTWDKWIATSEDSLRKEFEWRPQIKNFRDAKIKDAQLLASIWQESWPWDVAAIFNFMKWLDPESVVRESEFEVAAQSSWLVDRVTSLQLWNKVKEWDKLTPEQRKQFVWVAKELFRIREEAFNETMESYKQIAERRGLNPANVVLEIGRQQEQDRVWSISGRFTELATPTSGSDDTSLLNALNQ